MKSVTSVAISKTLHEFVSNASKCGEAVFPNDMALYADEAAKFWFKYEPIFAEVLDGDHGVCTSLKLRRLLNASRGAMGLERLFSAILALVPHSMHTERIVSHYNTVVGDSKSCMKLENINLGLAISMNSDGMANFNPIPAVAEFLSVKDRRYREPDHELYSWQEFVSKFFSGAKK